MAWLIVLSNGQAAEWVLREAKMAFRAATRPERLSPGDPFAIYVSRGAHGDPNHDEAQIAAIGRIASPVRKRRLVVKGGGAFDAVCDLEFDQQLPLREGVPFRPLVNQLQFIRFKEGWGAYLRRTIATLSDGDFRVIETAVKRAARNKTGAKAPASGRT